MPARRKRANSFWGSSTVWVNCSRVRPTARWISRPTSSLRVAMTSRPLPPPAVSAITSAISCGEPIRHSTARACSLVVPVPRSLGRWYSGERRTRKMPEAVSKSRSTTEASDGGANWERIRSLLVALPATCPYRA